MSFETTAQPGEVFVLDIDFGINPAIGDRAAPRPEPEGRWGQGRRRGLRAPRSTTG